MTGAAGRGQTGEAAPWRGFEGRKRAKYWDVMTRRLAALAFLLPAALLGATAPAEAQTTPLQTALSRTTAIDCRFTAHVMSDWDGAAATAEIMEAEFALSFTNVNADEGTADAGTDFGDAFINVRYTNEYLHFVQFFRAGPLYVTTVMAIESEDDRLLAVHTRHEYTTVALPGFTSRPEIYVGDCAID
jgi:hypothetical protein